MEKALSKYYRSISKCLPVDKKHKKQILEQIRHSVEDYRVENPAADIQGILEHFGTPQEITASYVENMTTPEILKKFCVRKTVLLVVCAVAAVALLMWGTGLAVTLINANKSIDGYGVTGSIEELDATEFGITED